MTINRYKLQVAAKGIDPALGKEYHHAESLFYSIGKTRFDSPPTHTHFHSTLQGPNSQHYHSSLSLFFPEVFKYVILSLKYPKSIYFSLVFLSSSPLLLTQVLLSMSMSSIAVIADLALTACQQLHLKLTGSY